MFFKVVTIEEFYKLFHNFSTVSDYLLKKTQDALDSVIFEDIVAKEDFPPFNRACMDGYAVLAKDTFGAAEASPCYLKVIGDIKIDEIPDIEVRDGECAQIYTGCPMPTGADAVVMAEYTEKVFDDEVEIRRSVSPYENVIVKGEDFSKGDILVQKGTRIRAQEIGILMEFGKCECKVYRQVGVGIISTGNELMPPDTKDLPLGKIRDVNSNTIGAIVKKNFAQPKYYGIIPDNRERLKIAIEKAISECDVVLISGGSSIGTKDLTEETIMSFHDSEILCHGVAISPGKPTLFAKIKDKPIIGIPGQVTSAQIVMHILVAPFLRYLSGEKDYFSKRYCPSVYGYLSKNVHSKKGRVDFIRVRLNETDNKIYAEPILAKSGIIRSLVQSHGIIKIPASYEGLLKDTLVEVILL